MSHTDVEIPTADGISPASLHTPPGDGPWPAVIVYPDAGGLRDAMRETGERLAGLGYLTLVPDHYYRHGRWAPFDMASAFGDAAERDRMMAMARSVTAEHITIDTAAYLDYLDGLPQTAASGVGITGYCMGGRLSMIVAGRFGDRIAAAASFHAGNLADPADPDSPHHRAASITATVYVGGASNDRSFPDEQRDRLDVALTAAGVRHTIETYDGAHGFAVTDMPTYDAAAAERHWAAMTTLFAGTLR